MQINYLDLGQNLSARVRSARCSEFSSYEIELQNRVTQNDVTLRVTNWKTFIQILLDFVKYQIKLRVININSKV